MRTREIDLWIRGTEEYRILSRVQIECLELLISSNHRLGRKNVVVLMLREGWMDEQDSEDAREQIIYC